MKTKSQPGDFRKMLEHLSSPKDPGKVFESFVRFAACALAAQTREAEYLAEAKHWEKSEMDRFAEALGALIMEMDAHPFTDLLGSYYMESGSSAKSRSGEVYSPKHICDLMARIALGDVESLPAEGPITVCEPACGSGAMILSLGEACTPEVRRRLRVTAIDINRLACDMTFVNTTLWDVPTRVIHGNALSGEFWAAWSNIHYLMPWLPPGASHQKTAGRGTRWATRTG